MNHAFVFSISLLVVCSLSNQTKSAEPSIQPTGKTTTIVAKSDSITMKDARSMLTVWTCDRNWKKRAKSEEKTLSENGDLLRWVQFVGPGQPLTDNYSYLYVGKQKLKEYRWMGKHMTHRAFSYDAQGRLQSEQCFEGKALSSTVKYIYPSDSAKHPTKETVVYAGEGNAGMTTVYTYNDAGQLLKEEQFDTSGPYETDQYQYHPDGRLKSKSMYVHGQDAGARYFYLYEGSTLVKDSVQTADGTTEYHSYESKTL